VASACRLPSPIKVVQQQRFSRAVEVNNNGQVPLRRSSFPIQRRHLLPRSACFSNPNKEGGRLLDARELVFGDAPFTAPRPE